MSVVAIRQTHGVSRINWWENANSVALVRRTSAKDCNSDEFDQFVAVCRELGLSPLRKQIYAFVFNKDDPDKRQMALVVGIDGGRSIAARSGNYRPDDKPPVWVFDHNAKNPLTNPHGIVSCTVGVYHRPTRADPFERITATVFWDEFAPIIRAASPDAYEWVGTGEYYPQGHKNAGKEVRRRQLRQGASAEVTERLDPKKEQWTRGGRHKIALCAEMQALRRGWPEDMSRLYVEEETDRAAATIDGEYSDLTPSEMVAKAEIDTRVERLGGPAILAALGENGALIRVPHGEFADRVMEATAKLQPAEVSAFVARNREALRDFWAHNKTDALELNRALEQRSAAAGAKAAPSDDTDTTAKSASGALTGQEAYKLKGQLLTQLRTMTSASELLAWSTGAKLHLDRLPPDMRSDIDTEFSRHQANVLGAK